MWLSPKNFTWENDVILTIQLEIPQYSYMFTVIMIVHPWFLVGSCYLIIRILCSVKRVKSTWRNTCSGFFIETMSVSSATQKWTMPLACIAYSSSNICMTGVGFSSEAYISSLTLVAGSGLYNLFTEGTWMKRWEH